MQVGFWGWAAFNGFILVMLALDLGVFNRKAHVIRAREALAWTAVWITLALLFGAWLWLHAGPQSAIEYLTGYLAEKVLSMDNIFVMLMIFGFFGVPQLYQHRVLFWGILGALVMRGGMILLGASLIARYHWILYLFGAFLVLTGIKMWWLAEHQPDIANNPLLKLLRRRLSVTPELRGNAFFVREVDPATGRLVRYATPLFLALCLVEAVDLVFAVDSVPAIFAITTDPFIVYTSNIFAILGLRALYFALAAMIERFRYLKYALALVLVFVGTKIFLVGFVGKFPPVLSLSVTFGLIAGGVIVSLWKTRPDAQRGHPAPASLGERS
jgi:tellurite resistance protein TerC